MQKCSMLRSLIAGGVLLTCAGAGAQTLTLHYQERPPYSRTTVDGDVTGLVATPAARALRDAGISFRWVVTPSQRQLALIQAGRDLHCGVGWFRNPERAALGKFSRELYRDRPAGALVRADLPLKNGVTVASLVEDKRFTLLLKEGYSYGQHLDGLLIRTAMPAQRTAVDPAQMARMLSAGRADWMIVAPEEAAELVVPGLRMIEFADMPPGLTRHLYCSQEVGDDWMARIDRALAAPR